jgi:hypothetical protein
MHTSPSPFEKGWGLGKSVNIVEKLTLHPYKYIPFIPIFAVQTKAYAYHKS